MDVDPRADEAQDGHAVHALAPTVIEYVPAGHKTHVFTLLPPDVAEYAPAGQFTHAADDVAPVAFEYVPATQFTQTLDPAAEYVPAGQFVHTTDEVTPTTPEYVPAEHVIHALDPVTVLYCPAGHGVHVRPAGPVYPASHTQSVIKPDMPSVFEFGGHKLQFALPSGDHCPAGQKRHVSGPVAL